MSIMEMFAIKDLQEQIIILKKENELLKNSYLICKKESMKGLEFMWI